MVLTEFSAIQLPDYLHCFDRDGISCLPQLTKPDFYKASHIFIIHSASQIL